ncbi:histone-like nucleoid-structuring protein Lsr2 [Rhodococcus sp. NBC_00297]|uniref:histone-like nucleoid-structuring protein Lsr2 n=1 Tax=Rhodococcus sp. NBC_00297 TaxID=2976005 RepID=UPI002E292F74|nr:Lsr2 family protein [Rhodococcus sp. NBC_00297]
MAKHVITQLTDDIDGTAIDDEAGESIEFSVNGVDYAIDLKAKNASEFHRKLDYYISHAERVGGRKKGPRKAAGKAVFAAPTTRDREQTRAIREWANANGYAVSARGRIPEHIIEAFNAAH